MSDASPEMEALTHRPSALARLGRWGLAGWSEARAMVALFRRAMLGIRRVEWREVVRQAYSMANRSIFFVTVIMAFTGAIMVIHACMQAQRLIGDLSIIGPGFLQLLLREFGPSIVAFMIAARYGAGVAAEIGAMQITEQIDAVRMTGADPETFLVAPRILGGVLGIVPIVTLGTAVAFVSGALAARYEFAIGWATYFRLSGVELSDVLVGVTKALAFGAAIPLVSSHAGLAASGGAPGVGRATTRAVIGSSVAVLGLDLLVSAIGYLIFF